MEAQVEEVAENRVRLRVDVPSVEVKHAVEHAASDLGASLKIPGFRKGKVPMPVLLARVGRQQLMAEAVESHIRGWFVTAAARARIRPVAQPDFEFDLPANDRSDWTFSATVEVQPKPTIGDWRGLEVPRREVEVAEKEIARELAELQAMVADLSPVDHRAAQPDDVVVLDLVDDAGDAQRDYVVELGAGRLAEELEAVVAGMSPGDVRRVRHELGDDESIGVEVTLKAIHEKVLRPLDDDLARAASEFGTLEELTASIEEDLREQLAAEVESEFRAAVADALVAANAVDAAGPLVEGRTRNLVAGLARSVEARGIPFESYLQLTNTEPQALVERMREEARRAVARELVLEAVADQLGIEVGDEEVDRVVAADAAGEDAGAAITALRESGAYEQVRADLRLRAALDRVAADVKPIAPEVAAARGRLWTPEQEKRPRDTKLWTPGSKEPA